MIQFERNENELSKEEWSSRQSELRALDMKKFIQEIEKRLLQMETTYTVDRIEEFVAVCENRTTGEMIQIDLNELPFDIKEGSILKYDQGRYQIDQKEQKKVEDRMKEKMNRLWKE